MEDSKANQRFQQIYYKWLKKEKKEHTQINFSDFCFIWNTKYELKINKAKREHLEEMRESLGLSNN